MKASRRGLLAGALALTASRALAATPSGSANGLNAEASAKGLRYGSAVNGVTLRQSPAYGQALAREAGILVSENAMKLTYAWRAPDALDFAYADEVAAFAQAARQRLRGHTLVWHEGLPDWVSAHLATGKARRSCAAGSMPWPDATGAGSRPGT